MTRKDLLAMLDIDAELFEFVWRIFDHTGNGSVSADDFVAAIALLTTSAGPEVSFEEQVKVCFMMFDTRDDGRLRCAYTPCLKCPHIWLAFATSQLTSLHTSSNVGVWACWAAF